MGTYMQEYRHTGIQPYIIETYMHIHMQTDRQTHLCADRQTDAQIDRLTHRQTETDREGETTKWKELNLAASESKALFVVKLTLSKTVCRRGMRAGCSLGTNSSSTSPNNRYSELHKCL